MSFESGPSPIEADLAKNNERSFVNTLDTLARHAEDILVQATHEVEATGVEMLFVLREGSYDPGTVHETSVALGLDGKIQVLVTQDGSGVIVTAPISIGKLGEIFDGNVVENDTLTEQVTNARNSSDQAGQAFMDRTLKEMGELISRPDNWRINPENPGTVTT